MDGTVLIVGAGIFGTSTAHHLSKRIPPSHIMIVDQHPLPTPGADSDNPPYGASHDINKIVRSDYSLSVYMDLAEEAIAYWQKWDLIKPFYHRTGWIAFGDEGRDHVPRIRQNYRDRSGEDPTKDMSFDSIRSEWGGLLKDIDLAGMESAYFNHQAGWAEADKAVAAMLDDAVKRGVRYRQGKVAQLVSDSNGIQGVKCEDGNVLTASKVLLATGAWTSELMQGVEDELKLQEDKRIENQVKAVGVCVAHFALTSEEKKKFDTVPVVVYGEHGMSAACPSGCDLS